MNESLSVKDQTERASAIRAELQAMQVLFKHQHARGWDALNELFRGGTTAEPSGCYAGKFVAINIAPGFTQLAELLASLWMPWLGKTFDAARHSGKNILTKRSYPLARLLNPLYRGFQADGPTTYQAFAFRTYTAPGLMDSGLDVLKIDYNLKENPSFTVRRVLDELVQLDNNLYLGKAHVRWWWGRWQTVAYFMLTK